VSSGQLKVPSDRSFGFTFAVVFGLIGSWLWWRASKAGPPFIAAGAVFALVAIVIPRILHPLNVVWMRFGLLLNKIVSPLILGVVFFVVFAPVGLFFRLIRRDALHRSFDSKRASYWNDRTPPGPAGESFPLQF
jgi:predicted membrane metal-binding protein